MAKTITNHEWTDPEGRRKQNQPKYPYQDWCDGQVWELTKGQDFRISVASMRTQLGSWSRRYRTQGLLPAGHLRTEAHLHPQGKDRLIVQYVRD